MHTLEDVKGYIAEIKELTKNKSKIPEVFENQIKAAMAVNLVETYLEVHHNNKSIERDDQFQEFANNCRELLLFLKCMMGKATPAESEEMISKVLHFSEKKEKEENEEFDPISTFKNKRQKKETGNVKNTPNIYDQHFPGENAIELLTRNGIALAIFASHVYIEQNDSGYELKIRPGKNILSQDDMDLIAHLFREGKDDDL